MLQLEKCSVQPAAQMRTYQERSRDMFDYYIFWEAELGSEQRLLASRVLRVTRVSLEVVTNQDTQPLHTLHNSTSTLAPGIFL